jgi:hypothetical protein
MKWLASVVVILILGFARNAHAQFPWSLFVTPLDARSAAMGSSGVAELRKAVPRLVQREQLGGQSGRRRCVEGG